MSLRSKMGYPDVPQSITNENVSNGYLDENSPISFLKFIQIIRSNFEPESLQKYYAEYIRRWNRLKSREETDNDQEIKNRYKEFIRDITLDHTTLEEKKFLSKIDYEDPYDLEIVSSFYSKKLLEICSYYNNKREDLKLETTRKRLVGSIEGSEKTIKEIVLNYLETHPEKSIYYDTQAIKRDLEIEIEELYDNYALYFNQSPDEMVFDKRDFGWGEDIFLKENSEIVKSEFGNLSIDLLNLKEIDALIEHKRLLTKKSIFTDYYYISTNSTNTDFVSGRLFQSNSPSKNIFNRDHPTTASTENKDHLVTPREKGFFRPHKTSIVIVDGKQETFMVNRDALKADTIYYFPDPKIIGTNGGVLTFVLDDSFLKRNYSSGVAVNQPVNEDTSNTYYGYSTQYEKDEGKYLSQVFDSGFVQDAKRDLGGNLYGLFKISDNYNKNVRHIEPIKIKSLQLNGGYFFDEMYGEGYEFDYSVHDDTTYKETIRSSLTAMTSGFEDFHSYLLFMRNFDPYDDLMEPTEAELVREYVIKDGGFFTKTDLTKYDDPISSDLSAFPGNGSYYYSSLLEGGLHDSSPVQRALLDPSVPHLSANLTVSVRPSGNNDIGLVDGGFFTDNFTIDYEFPDYSYDFSPNSETPTIFGDIDESSIYLNDRRDLDGTLMIKNSYNGTVKPLFECLPYLQVKHSENLVSQLSGGIKRFELSHDTLFLETSAFLTVEPISYTDGSFENPDSEIVSIGHGLTSYNRITNRFRVGDSVYYATLNTENVAVSSNNFIIYPKIYKYDLEKNKNVLLFPISNDRVTNFFNISGGDVRYTSIDSTTLTYNSRNSIFNLSYLLKDQNGYISMRRLDFRLDPEIRFIMHEIFNPNIGNFSNILSSNYSSTLNIYLSGTPAQNEGEILII